MADTENRMGSFLAKLNHLPEKYSLHLLIAVLLIAFIIRLKYMTVNAALWWDEADYMTLAKHFGLGLPEQAAPWRARPIPMLWGIFYALGANEWFIRFFNQLVALGGIWLTYIIGKEFYDRKTGLLAALFMGVYFEYIFWSARISLDLYNVVFCCLIALFFYRGYVKSGSKKYLYAAGALYGAGIYVYDGIAFIGIALFIYLIVTERWRFFKDKRIWLIAMAAVVAVLPFAIYNIAAFGNPYPRLNLWFHGGQVSFAENPESITLPSFTSELFSYFTNIPYYLSPPLPSQGAFLIFAKYSLLILFFAGLLSFTDVFVGFDKVMKRENGVLLSGFYILALIFGILLSYGIINAVSGAFYFEARYVFPAMPAIFIVCALGAKQIFGFISKYNKAVAAVLVTLAVISGVYAQLVFAQSLIMYKKDSFAAVNQAGTWLKEHTNPNEEIVGCGLSVPFVYYAERKFNSFGNNASRADALIAKYNPNYIVMDGHDPACTLNYPAMHQERFKPVQVFFLDKEQKQPIVIIYEVLSANK